MPVFVAILAYPLALFRIGDTNAPMTDAKAGLREFEKVSSKGWDEGVHLTNCWPA
jgi:hypothetical protein